MINTARLKNKSITFVINTLEEGGAAKVLTFIANHCINVFAEVNIITFYTREIYIPLNERINLVSLNMEFGDNIISRLHWRLMLSKRLRKTIKDLKTDIVCSFISDVTVSTRLAMIGTNIPIIGAERGNPYALGFIWMLLTKIAYCLCDLIVFQTNMAADFYGKMIKKKSVVIPNPYITDTPLKAHDGKRKKIIVGVGRFEKEKGFDLLIKAFSEVYRIFPEYKLVIYGDGKLREEYTSLIRKMGLENEILLPGHVSNIQDIIKEYSVFVLSSHTEGMPNALIEAMIAGVPTVSTNCPSGGPAFLTQNGKRGLLVPINDINAIAEGIITIIKNGKYANHLSRAGLEIVKELDPNKIFLAWLKCFDEVLPK